MAETDLRGEKFGRFELEELQGVMSIVGVVVKIPVFEPMKRLLSLIMILIITFLPYPTSSLFFLRGWRNIAR